MYLASNPKAMKNVVWLLPAIASVLSVAWMDARGQEIPPRFLEGMSMRSIGPSIMSGRVTAIDVAPGNPHVIFAGTASGGLWKSESGGVTWLPVFDEQPVLGIGAVKVDPSNPDVIWAGTGEGNPRNSQTSGRGIFRSPDNGRTWECRGLEETRTIHRIIVHPSRGEVVYAGAPGSAWGPGPDRGVYRTADSGKSWKKVLFVNDSVGCADLVMDPRNPDKLFAAMWQYGRKPWFFESGGPGSGLYMTLDSGQNWRKLGKESGLPEGPFGRIGVAIAPGNSRVVYAVIEAKKTALYRSNDGGFSWSMVNDKDVGNRPFYYSEIYVSPVNENHLIYLYTLVSESIDGGKTWKVILPYNGAGVHPDHHAFWWSPDDPKLMIEGNDGGLNISRDGGVHWDFASNIPVAQFYHINFDMDEPYHVYGGMQDNGSWKGPAYVWQTEGIVASDWQEVLFGDGFDVVPDPTNSRYLYAMSQGGELHRVDTYTGESGNVKPAHPEGLPLRFNWNAAVAADPLLPGALYFGSQYLHYTTDQGLSWELRSPDLTTNDPEKLIYHTSGGLTPDVTTAENHCTILCIAPSPMKKEVIWVGTDDGRIQLTRDGGTTWKDFSGTIPGMPKGAQVPHIVASSHQEGEVWVVVNNYKQNDWRPCLYYSSDFGKSWTNLANDRSVYGHCLSVVQDDVEPGLVFLGTEHGLYVSINKGKRWTRWPTKSFPAVAVQDMRIHPREADLVIGTFGRAAYVLDDIRPLRKLASENQQFTKPGLHVFTPPDAVRAQRRRHRGERFPADEFFVGQNKSSGAVISYYIQFAKGQDLSKKKIKISILSLTGDTLRWFTHAPDTGMNRVIWNLRENGFRMPSWNEPEEKADPPGGFVSVPPGFYKAVLSFDSWKDSTTVFVRHDPRLEFNGGAYNANKLLLNRIQEECKLTVEALDELRKAANTVEVIRSQLSLDKSPGRKDALVMCDSIAAAILKLRESALGFKERVGYPDRSKFLIDKLYKALYSVSESGTSQPGSNAEWKFEAYARDNRVFLNKVNAFFDSEWIAFRYKMEELNAPLFFETKRF